MTVPPTFDAAFYVQHYEDLSHFSARAALDHYNSHGRAEGRIASALATREGLRDWIGEDTNALEIGPFCNPFLTGSKTAYLDVLTATELRSRADAIGLDASRCPERIDFVGDIAQVDRTFDLVFSSHSIEHQPDLVHHLAGVERVLKPSGVYALIVPDKRFCFDHFNPESTIAGVLEAHQERRTTHGIRSVIEHIALVTHNDAQRHWAGDHAPLPVSDQPRRIAEAMAYYEANRDGYLDVHAWCFTPTNFHRILETLNLMGLTALKPVAVYDTPADRMEFCAILQA